MKRGGLGRGLDVLLPQSGELLETVVRDISIDEIDPNASQPRRDFDKEALEQLADSIREAGVLSPILVVENGMRYRIVAGERRYRAARLAGQMCIRDSFWRSRRSTPRWRIIRKSTPRNNQGRRKDGLCQRFMATPRESEKPCWTS